MHGPGLRHVSEKQASEEVLEALWLAGVQPPFDEYHFIDLDGEKVDFLKAPGTAAALMLTFYNADSNQVMLESVLPRFSYAKRTRAMCVLHPYAAHAVKIGRLLFARQAAVGQLRCSSTSQSCR